MGENCDEFDEWPAIRQSFPFQPFPCYCFSYEAYNQFVKVLLVKLSDMLDSSNFLTCLIHQISSDFSTVKVLRYTVYCGYIFMRS